LSFQILSGCRLMKAAMADWLAVGPIVTGF